MQIVFGKKEGRMVEIARFVFVFEPLRSEDAKGYIFAGRIQSNVSSRYFLPFF